MEERDIWKKGGKGLKKGVGRYTRPRVERGMGDGFASLLAGQYSRCSHDGIVARFGGSRPKNGVNDKPALESVSKSIRVR